MKYRTLGRTGFKVSEIGFGAWAIGGRGLGAAEGRGEPCRPPPRAGHRGDVHRHGAGLRGWSQRTAHRERHGGKRSCASAADRCASSPRSRPSREAWPASPYDTAEQRYSERVPAREGGAQPARPEGGGPGYRPPAPLVPGMEQPIPSPLQHPPGPQEGGEGPVLRDLELRVRRERGESIPSAQGSLDVVETVYNIFDQNPARELLPTAKEHRVAIVARSPLDEGALTGKMTAETVFPEGRHAA